jgi:hypothetical protein
MPDPRTRSISLMFTIAPLLAVLCVLLGDPTAEPGGGTGPEPPAMVVSIGIDATGATASSDQSGLPLGAMPAPRAGRLRVREADRLGPAKLHLPPPAA